MKKEKGVKSQIGQARRDLAAIYQFNQEYLDRRAGHGRATKTDRIMTRHQKSIDRISRLLDLLEKTYPVYGEFEMLERVVSPVFGTGTVIGGNAEDNIIFVQFDGYETPSRLALEFARLRKAGAADERDE